ncbi:hypothetical protein [Pseudomonas sp. TCU-HL1]|uniref:hypothetical protein n=1 Tax=Pseudomonas sp. TCU-HL1 TaxID=1856685 RepID=UPI00083DCBD4|nr:hypothetical protein [Pseudomonas sp. TCU-HL1]AOE86142.1 hypothetical protein THL1_3594 [Pseudomonas sp. TCU-HL1]
MSHSSHTPALLITLSLLGACSSQSENDGLNATTSTASAYAPGVPGGVESETEQVWAVVTAVDQQKRTFTLEDEQGNRQTFNAVPQMRNFSQLKAGDRVKAIVTHERVIQLRAPGQDRNDAAAGLVATTPQGSKPGMLVADTEEVTAIVKAIDTTQHTATLEFADGSRKVVRVRPDIELKPSYLNQEVAIRMSSALAISVEAP